MREVKEVLRLDSLGFCKHQIAGQLFEISKYRVHHFVMAAEAPG
jgi:hypothetical protein